MSSVALSPTQSATTPAHQAYAQAEQRLFSSLGLTYQTRTIELSYPAMTIRALAVGEGQPVLVVPGGVGNGSMLAPLFAQLPGYRLVTLDRPGAGLSDGIDHRQIDLRQLAVRTLEAVLDAYDLERVPVISNSMGGLWAFWLGLDRPDRVLLHAQMGCPALALGTSAPAFMRLSGVPVVGNVIHNLSKPKDIPATREGLKYMGQTAASRARLSDEEIALAFQMYQLPTYDVAWKSLLKTVVPFGFPNRKYMLSAEELAQVRQPVQFVWGGNDPFGDLDVARQSKAALPDAHLHILPEGGHLPWMDAPEEVGAVFARFIAAHL